MAERRWREGQLVEWPKVTPYRIELLVDEAGNVHVSERGRYHPFWHRELRTGQIVLVHHFGPEGASHIRPVKRQFERVILKYTGLSIAIPRDDQTEIPEEEKETGVPILRNDFPAIASQLEQIRIPGEQQRINQWIRTLQEVSQDLPTVTNHGHLSQIRERLENLVKQKGFGGLTNRYKRGAADALVNVRTGSQMLLGVNEAQGQLLRRAQQTVEITLGTMRRYNGLERLQTSWNQVVEGLPTKAAASIRALQNPPLEDDGSIERTININILHPQLGLEAQLRLLKGEPYFSGAQEFIAALSAVKSLWGARNYDALLANLSVLAREMEIWKRRIKEENTGVGFGRYNLG